MKNIIPISHEKPLFIRFSTITTVILLKDYHNQLSLSRKFLEIMGSFHFSSEFHRCSLQFLLNPLSKSTNMKKKTPIRSPLNYRIIAINPPDPSFIILSSVSFNLYLAFSGINDNLA